MKILIKKVLKTDLNFTFLLRNNKLIRKNFFTSNIISIKEHKDWFLKKIKNKKDLFLIIMKDKHKIGTIRYDKKEFYYEISISILPKYQSQNLGSEALKASENIVKKGMILSNIKKSNTKSLKFFIKNGYSVLSKGKKIILYKVLNNQQFVRNNKLIDKIQQIRKKNNVNWMDILRIAFESSPDKTKKVFENIFADDKSINNISKKLFS
tara:strand:+ start:1687 stop:2313 length:627 start_codon:yes stop_codon:yes gene_type:complete